MVKIAVLSDLHLESGPLEEPLEDADVTVFAGDVWTGTRGLEWMRQRCPGGRIVYVLGNHEYYGHALPKLTLKLKERGADLGIDVLEKDEVEIRGLRFFGCTLWTDFEGTAPREVGLAAAAADMNDYRRIRVSPAYRRLRPTDTAGLHVGARKWLAKHIAEGRTEGSVIVTHHAPSLRSLSSERRRDVVSNAYASNLDDLVERSRAWLWVHGHIHRAVDYQIGGTRVLSNPRGYTDEPVEGFDKDLRLERNSLG